MYEVKVTGMTCGSCASSIRRILKRSDPDVEVSVNVEEGTVSVQSKIDQTRLAELVEEAGFPVLAVKNLN